MNRWPMIHRRGEFWYLRATAPRRVQPAYGKKEVWVSLRTRDPDEAKVLVVAATVRLKATFKKLMEQSSRVSPMGPEELAGLYQQQVFADNRSYPRTGNGVMWRT